MENSECRARKRLTLPSFSSGAKVHVEYTSLPPAFNIPAAASRISSCLFAHSSTFCILHSRHASSFFLNIPSPEQGASTRILSKYCSNRSAKVSGASFRTSALQIPILSIFSDKILALAGCISLHTKSPCPRISAAICVLFPPGAAHKSRILSPGPALRKAAGAMALAS